MVFIQSNYHLIHSTKKRRPLSSTKLTIAFMDMTAKKELLTVLHMKERTQGEDIFLSRKPSCQCAKLVSVTTAAAPNIVGCLTEFITKCREDYAFSPFLNNQWSIQQVSWAKILIMKEKTDVPTKVACYICTGLLKRQLFCVHLEKDDCHHSGSL